MIEKLGYNDYRSAQATKTAKRTKALPVASVAVNSERGRMNAFAMDIVTVPHVGSVALGIVMGALVWYFVARFSEFTPKALGAVVSVVAGGAVLKWFENDCTRGAVWYYPLGLLVSTGLFFIFWLAGPEGEKYDKFRKNF